MIKKMLASVMLASLALTAIVSSRFCGPRPRTSSRRPSR